MNELKKLDNRVALVPINRELAEDIIACCRESGTDIIDVMTYGMNFILDNYIDNRNARYSRMKPDEIKAIYPGFTDAEAKEVIKLAKEDVLGIIKPKEPPALEGKHYCPEHFFDLRENEYYDDEEDEDDIELNEDEYRFTPAKPNDALAVLPALSELVKTAHDVNVNIQIVVKDE